MWEENKNTRLVSGLLIRDLPILTNYSIKDSFKIFPYSILLTQACDIESHYKVLSMMGENPLEVNRQFISSVLLCPAFDEERFQKGEHLTEQFEVKLKTINSDQWNPIKNNRNIRFQFLQSNESKIPNLIIDFKQYFTVTFSYLESFYNGTHDKSFILNHMQLMNLSDRLAHYLQRVAIPDSGTVLEQVGLK